MVVEFQPLSFFLMFNLCGSSNFCGNHGQMGRIKLKQGEVRRKGGTYFNSTSRPEACQSDYLDLLFPPQKTDKDNWKHLSHEKNPGWLGYIGDYTTQLYGDYNKP